MLSNRNSNLVIPAGLIGFIGVAVMSRSFFIGLGLFLVAIGLFAYALLGGRKPPQIPAQRTIVSEFELTQDPKASRPAPQPVGSKFYQPLLTTLRASGYNLQLPVVFTDAEPLTAQMSIIQIAGIIRERKIPIEQMIPAMPAMYEMLWNYNDEACERYGDLEMIKIHIASSVFFRYQLEHTQPV